MTARAAWPLTIYYDASCPLCREELHALAAHDHDGLLRLHDIADPHALDDDCRAAGIAHAELMERIHARDAAGRWFIGVPVFELAYGAAGLQTVAAVFAAPRLRPLWDRLYPWVARHRNTLSMFRLNRAYGALVRWLARRAGRRAARCAAGACPSDRPAA